MKKRMYIFMLVISFMGLAACQKRDEGWLSDESTILSAHRGAQIVAPENTVESIKAAGRLKYKAIEIDPRKNKDGGIYLMHDDTVNRTTNGQGNLSELSNDQINNLKINTENYPKYKNKKVSVPNLDTAIKAAHKNELIVNIDGSKSNWFDQSFSDKVVYALEKNNALNDSFFVITDAKQRNYFNKRYPRVCISWLVDSKASIDSEISKAKKYKRAMLSISNEYATNENIKKLNAAKVYYQVYGVNDYKRLKELKKLKAKMIETDTLQPQN